MPPEVFQRHLAALSPYFNVYRQPRSPVSRNVKGAVYLLRHGILEVAHHDYNAYLEPFLSKLRALQCSEKSFVKGQMAQLQFYRSWITKAHVGMVSRHGFSQSVDLGHSFRERYQQWLNENRKDGWRPLMTIWTDSATRCRLTAITFAEAFSGKVTAESGSNGPAKNQVDTQVMISDASSSAGTCNNLSWHTALEVDQQAGTHEMKQILKTTTAAAYGRLQDDWLAAEQLTPEDIYAMQLLHCYDVVSGRGSPFETYFTPQDWIGFEYVRDAKYHYSEGYGSENAPDYAVPWMISAMAKLKASLADLEFPLHMAFTHREEVLYLACLLGVCHENGWVPNLERVDSDRKWRVALLAPYLGHIGLESYSSNDEMSVRVIVNGEVRSAFFGEIEADEDGGYKMGDVDDWLAKKACKYKGFDGWSSVRE